MSEPSLSQQLSDFTTNVINAPESPRKAALLVKIHEATEALRDYEAGMAVQRSPVDHSE